MSVLATLAAGSASEVGPSEYINCTCMLNKLAERTRVGEEKADPGPGVSRRNPLSRYVRGRGRRETGLKQSRRCTVALKLVYQQPRARPDRSRRTR